MRRGRTLARLFGRTSESANGGLRALIVDPALHSMGGHHYTAMERLQGELRRLGIDFEALGSAYADERVRRGLAVAPCFEHSLYGRDPDRPDQFAAWVGEAAAVLSGRLRGGRLPDLIVLPCVDPVLIAALAAALQRNRGWRPRLLMWILFPPLVQPQAGGVRSAQGEAEYRDAFARLAAQMATPGDLQVFCETERLAATYRALLGIEVGVGQGPGLAMQDGGREAPRTPGPPRIVCVGYASAAKGYGLLPEAIQRVLRVEPQAQFFIHGVRTQLDATIDDPTFQALRRLSDRVVTRTDVLESDAYLAWLGRGDLLLLPYDPAVYATRGSGVFADATALGLPAIVTAGCGFAEEAFRQGRAVPIAPYDSSGVADAAVLALHRLDELAQRAREVASTATADTVRATLEQVANEMRAERAITPRG